MALSSAFFLRPFVPFLLPTIAFLESLIIVASFAFMSAHPFDSAAGLR